MWKSIGHGGTIFYYISNRTPLLLVFFYFKFANTFYYLCGFVNYFVLVQFLWWRKSVSRCIKKKKKSEEGSENENVINYAREGKRNENVSNYFSFASGRKNCSIFANIYQSAKFSFRKDFRHWLQLSILRKKRFI